MVDRVRFVVLTASGVRRTARWLAALLLAAAALAVPPAALAADGPPTMSDAAKRTTYLDILERFVPHAESYWNDGDPGSFSATGPGVTQPRGDGDIAYMYATLLAARPQQPQFAGVPRATLERHAIEAIRHEAMTNSLSGAGDDRWGNGTWQASLETYGWGWAAHLLWDDLDASTRALVDKVVAGEADILLTKPMPSRVVGDTGAEDNGWNSVTPELASVLMPDDPHRAAWEEAAKRLAMNASSRASDEQDPTVVDGRPVSDWISTANLYPDLTLENHGFFNPIYQQGTHGDINEAAMMAAAAGRPVPQAFSFRLEDVWTHILGPAVTDDGDVVMAQGQDWTSKDYQHLNVLAALATRLHRADASVAESRALTLVARRQATTSDGAILGQQPLGYESMLVMRLANAYWTHVLFGPSPVPTADEYAAARAQTGGVHEYPYVDITSARTREALVTMSWDSTRPMALVVPAGDRHPDDPIGAAYTPGSLVGGASGPIGEHTCDCGPDRFATAGSIGGRRFALATFPDGVTMALDRGEGTAFNVDFERIPGLTGARPVRSDGGESLGDLPGDWLAVDDRLGMVVRGGGGLSARDIDGGNPRLEVVGSRTTGSGDRAALLLPNATAAQTEAAAPSVVKPDLPDGWSALYGRAPDGTGRLAVARWDGPGSTELVLRDGRGAPVTRWDATARGDTARATVPLAAPAASEELVRFFVDADAPVGVRALGEHRARLVNDGRRAVHVHVMYVGADGHRLDAERVLGAGEQADARVVDGRLITAGPEYEPLRAARERAGKLLAALAGWEAGGTLSHGQALRLTAAAHRLARDLDAALAADTLVRPDTARAARAVDAARRHLDQLSGGDDGRLPDAVAQRLAADRAAIGRLLDRVRDDDLTVTVRVAALDPFLVGETTGLRATILNRGSRTARRVRLDAALPSGWSAEPDPAELGELRAGDSRVVDIAVHVAPDAKVGSGEQLRFEVTHRAPLDAGTATATVAATVQPAVTVAAVQDALPLAAGGYNVAEFDVVNHAARARTLTFAATVPDGLTATPSAGSLELAAGETRRLTVELRDAGVASGTSRLDVAVRSDGGGVAQASTELRHSDDLARNGLGARWPSAFASGSQSAYPPSLATDGSTGTFWVSDGTQAGQGPSPSAPQFLGVDFGAAVRIASVRMTPRSGYGPRAYSIEVSDDGETWRQVADVPAAANGPVTTTFTPVTARLVRLRITDAYDRVRPPRNVQVAGLEVRAP